MLSRIFLLNVTLSSPIPVLPCTCRYSSCFSLHFLFSASFLLLYSKVALFCRISLVSLLFHAVSTRSQAAKCIATLSSAATIPQFLAEIKSKDPSNVLLALYV